MQCVPEPDRVRAAGVEVMDMLTPIRIGGDVAILLTHLVAKLVNVDNLENVSHRSAVWGRSPWRPSGVHPTFARRPNRANPTVSFGRGSERTSLGPPAGRVAGCVLVGHGPWLGPTNGARPALVAHRCSSRRTRRPRSREAWLFVLHGDPRLGRLRCRHARSCDLVR